MEVIDKLQASGDKLKEVEIVIDKDDIELSRRRFLTRTNFGSQLIANQFRKVYHATTIQFEASVNALLRFFFGMFKCSLHITDSGDNGQHLRMKRIQLVSLIGSNFSFSQVHNNRSHPRHRLAKFITRSFNIFTLLCQFCDNGIFALPHITYLVKAFLP